MQSMWKKPSTTELSTKETSRKKPSTTDLTTKEVSEEEDSYEVLTAPDDFSAVREALEQAGVPMLEAQVAMVPQTYVELTDEKDIKNLQKTLDLLDEDDDVTDVWTNWDE